MAAAATISGPNTAFELRVSNHIWDKQKNVTGLFKPDEEPAICYAGQLVTEEAQLPNEGYTGIANENAWFMGTPGYDPVGTVYACNTFNVNEIQDPVTGNIYKVGTNTLGLPIPAGQRGTYTRIDEGDMMRFGIGNFSGTPTVGQYAIVGETGVLIPAGDAPNTMNALYFEVLGTGTFTQGAYAAFGYVLVRAHRVHAVAANPS